MTATDVTGVFVHDVQNTGNPACQQPPAGVEFVALKTQDAMDNAPVRAVLAGGNQPTAKNAPTVTLSCCFPDFCRPVDLFIAYRSPEGNLHYVNEKGQLGSEPAVYKSATAGGFSQTFDPLGAALNPGLWEVAWVIHPTDANWKSYGFYSYRTNLAENGCQPIPSTVSSVVYKTPAEIDAAPVGITREPEGGKAQTLPTKPTFFCDFGEFCSPVDLYIAFVAPDGSQYFPDASGVLGPVLTAFKAGTTGGISQVFDAGGLTFVPGQWQVVWLVLPSGGDWSAYTFHQYTTPVN
jgi:hypothetical protein